MSRTNARDRKPLEWARLASDPDLDGLEVLHARYVKHRFSPHVHEEYAIGVIEHGVEHLGIGKRKAVTLSAGSIVLLNPGELHDGSPGSDEGWTYRMLYPPANLVRGIMDEYLDIATEMPYFPEAAVRDDGMFALIRTTHRVLMDDKASRLEKQVRLANMLGLLVSRHGHQQAKFAVKNHKHARIRRAVDHIDAHFDEAIALDTISGIAGLSRFHFCRAFKQTIGISPHAYQTHRRIEHSKKLIKAGKPLADVAAATGFFDQSHLGRHFKRIVGVSPGVYAA